MRDKLKGKWMNCVEKHSMESATHVVLLMELSALTWNDWPGDSHRSEAVYNLSGKPRDSHVSEEIRSGNKSHIDQ